MLVRLDQTNSFSLKRYRDDPPEMPDVLSTGLRMKLSRRSALLSGAAGLGLLRPQVVGAETAAAVPRERVERYLPDLDELVRDALQRTGVPGLSIAVVHGDQVVHLAGFGVR